MYVFLLTSTLIQQQQNQQGNVQSQSQVRQQQEPQQVYIRQVFMRIPPCVFDVVYMWAYAKISEVDVWSL